MLLSIYQSILKCISFHKNFVHTYEHLVKWAHIGFIIGSGVLKMNPQNNKDTDIVWFWKVFEKLVDLYTLKAVVDGYLSFLGLY